MNGLSSYFLKDSSINFLRKFVVTLLVSLNMASLPSPASSKILLIVVLKIVKLFPIPYTYSFELSEEFFDFEEV